MLMISIRHNILRNHYYLIQTFLIKMKKYLEWNTNNNWQNLNDHEDDKKVTFESTHFCIFSFLV